MSRLIDERVIPQLQAAFKNLVNPVRLINFTHTNACPNCSDQTQLLKEISALSNKITLQVYDFVLNGDEVMNYKIDKIPATTVVGKRDFGIRFYGLTAGYEFGTLIEDIIMVSSERTGLDPRLEILVQAISEPVHMQVMTTLTCPYCPKMVQTAHRFAFLNDNIQADMVEMAEFPHLAQRYNVTATPKTIINEVHSFVGALPAEAVYLEILKAVNPQKYRRIEEEITDTQTNKVNTKQGHVFEVAVVGGGPAAMSAAIYASRKGLDVIVIAKKIGGQITYTSSIDNYLGLPEINGSTMTDVFVGHLEKYKVAKLFGVNVSSIEKSEIGFELILEDNQRLKAKSVIYCAGKEYRKLGVPGEDRFLGNGVGFCATCDAPLYAGKRVAVVGGGNSAFTSVRDLLAFASEIHVIHRRNEFTADAQLIQEIKQSSKVKFHTPFTVKEFLGTDKLSGIRIESSNNQRFDIPVEGVFLEIGLTPNSSAVKNLIPLNQRGEVPTNRSQATQVRGLFAAGDVTDTEEKQIAIAVGQGALAALSAYKYLIENNLLSGKQRDKESWE
jgi:glutaredoxin-like protein